MVLRTFYKLIVKKTMCYYCYYLLLLFVVVVVGVIIIIIIIILLVWLLLLLLLIQVRPNGQDGHKDAFSTIFLKINTFVRHFNTNIWQTILE